MLTNVVIDISHYEGHVDFDAVVKEPIVAVISKASYGLQGLDNTHGVRRDAAKAHGLLWGSYHFGTGEGTGQQQAENFLGAVGEGRATDLIALDFEPNVDAKGNPLGPTMTLEQAREFVAAIHGAYSSQTERSFHAKANADSTVIRTRIPRASERCGRGDAGLSVFTPTPSCWSNHFGACASTRRRA